MAFILTQALSKGKRVRLIDGHLTPVFEYYRQAVIYSESKGMSHAIIKKLNIELDFKKK